MRIKVSYIVHMPGHKGSDGSEKPWVIKSHETGKIISSHSSKAAAEKHLKQIQYFKHKGKLMEFNQIESLDQLIKEADLISKVPIDEKRIDASNIDKQLIRDAIIAELDAINLYEQSAESVSNTKIKEVLLDIAKEEKTHVGELETLLFMIDKEQSNEMLQGVDEVMSKKSFIGYKNLDTLIKIADASTFIRIKIEGNLDIGNLLQDAIDLKLGEKYPSGISPEDMNKEMKTKIEFNVNDKREIINFVETQINNLLTLELKEDLSSHLGNVTVNPDRRIDTNLLAPIYDQLVALVNK